MTIYIGNIYPVSKWLAVEEIQIPSGQPLPVFRSYLPSEMWLKLAGLSILSKGIAGPAKEATLSNMYFLSLVKRVPEKQLLFFQSRPFPKRFGL